MLRSILQELAQSQGLHDEVERAHGSCPGSCSGKGLLGFCVHGICYGESLLSLRADVCGGEAECGHGSCQRGCES